MCVRVFLNKAAGSHNCSFIKKRLQHRFFSVKFANLLRISCFTNISSSESFRYPACNFIKKEPPVKMFFCEFCKNFQNIFSFDRTPDDCFLCLSVNFEKFFRTLLLQSTSGKLLISCKSCRIEPPDTVKNYFTGTFQAFYTRTISSHSKEIPENYLWRS